MRSKFGLYQLFCRCSGVRISYRKWLAMGIAGLCFAHGNDAKATVSVSESGGTLNVSSDSAGDDLSISQYDAGGGNYWVKVGGVRTMSPAMMLKESRLSEMPETTPLISMILTPWAGIMWAMATLRYLVATAMT